MTMTTTKPKTRKNNKLWRNEDLREAFDLYNKLYFGGKLEATDIRFTVMEGLGKTVRFRTVGKRRSQYDKFRILISNQLRDSRRLWATTLLHEMVHLEQQCKYSCGIKGSRFNKRMAVLAVQGAFNGIW